MNKLIKVIALIVAGSFAHVTLAQSSADKPPAKEEIIRMMGSGPLNGSKIFQIRGWQVTVALGTLTFDHAPDTKNKVSLLINWRVVASKPGHLSYAYATIEDMLFTPENDKATMADPQPFYVSSPPQQRF